MGLTFQWYAGVATGFLIGGAVVNFIWWRYTLARGQSR